MGIKYNVGNMSLERLQDIIDESDKAALEAFEMALGNEPTGDTNVSPKPVTKENSHVKDQNDQG